ncbi:MFS transporter [Kineosporia sp. NBRC 101677]|uniref:MFS transporter n=1 Tax=Kineosporia sp. NBRC 101677 TaxID=3032197 RepID=UPI0024A400A0|nr:MFS transporter [Kineosporia sp. NBRC 101677]GLY14923.1 MFS transporter [Kineosporia sp. NBRC 101677]
MPDRNFGRLYWAHTVSSLGTALGSGALPLIAVTVLGVAAWQVSALAALSGIAGAVLALPLGHVIEYRRKRPVMVAADLFRFLVIATVPVAIWAQWLTFAQLCLVAVLTSAATIAFGAAGGAHLKALVAPGQLHIANSRFESASWTTTTVGSSAGGFLISTLGSGTTLALDALSYLVSACCILRIRRPEPVPPPSPSRMSGRDLVAGWAYVRSRPDLRALLANALLFGAGIMAAAPLTAVLMLQDLGLSAWQYGLALGLPCLGGILGSALTPRLVARFGFGSLLLGAGALRTVWLLPLPFVPPGTAGLVLLIGADFGLLVCAGVFNPLFATYRAQAVDDQYLARVITAWAISSRIAQPTAIAAGGVLAALVGLRPTLLVAAVVTLLSAVVLPWRSAST